MALFRDSDHPGHTIMQEMQSAATAGNLTGLQQALEKWDVEVLQNYFDDQGKPHTEWFSRTMEDVANLLDFKKKPADLNWLALQRVLISAAKSGQAEVVAYLLDNKGCVITSKSLILALGYRHFNVMQIYIDRGWGINDPIRDYQCPILRDFINSEVHVRWCLQQGANPMARSKNGYNDIPGHAGRHSPVRVLKLLQEYGADFQKSDALIFAAEGRHEDRVDVMAYLLDECNIPINQRKYEYDPELFQSWRRSRLGTALHSAAESRAIECAKFLLGRGIDPKILDTNGFLAVEIAQGNKCEEIVELLGG